MSNTNLLPYQREGAWFSMHSFHYACAYKSLHAFQTAQSFLAAKEASLSVEVKDISQDHQDSFIFHETMSHQDNVEQAFVSSILYSCMTVEAFINNYGVRRLGQNYFRGNLERLGITEKFSLLMLVCHGILIFKDDPDHIKLRAMFDTRNQLVHPKTREFSVELLKQVRQETTMERRLTLHFDHMEAVIDRLCSLDNHIHRDFEFRKPYSLK